MQYSSLEMVCFPYWVQKCFSRACKVGRGNNDPGIFTLFGRCEKKKKKKNNNTCSVVVLLCVPSCCCPRSFLSLSCIPLFRISSSCHFILFIPPPLVSPITPLFKAVPFCNVVVCTHVHRIVLLTMSHLSPSS